VPARLAEGYWVWGMADQGNHRGLPLRVRTDLSGPNENCPKICTDTLGAEPAIYP